MSRKSCRCNNPARGVMLRSILIRSAGMPAFFATSSNSRSRPTPSRAFSLVCVPLKNSCSLRIERSACLTAVRAVARPRSSTRDFPTQKLTELDSFIWESFTAVLPTAAVSAFDGSPPPQPARTATHVTSTVSPNPIRPHCCAGMGGSVAIGPAPAFIVRRIALAVPNRPLQA